MIGSSRSGSKDFEQVVDLYRKYPDIVEKLALLKGHEINVCTMQDIVQAFEMDLSTSWENSIEMDDLINRWGITMTKRNKQYILITYTGNVFSYILKDIVKVSI